MSKSRESIIKELQKCIKSPFEFSSSVVSKLCDYVLEQRKQAVISTAEKIKEEYINYKCTKGNKQGNGICKVSDDCTECICYTIIANTTAESTGNEGV